MGCQDPYAEASKDYDLCEHDPDYKPGTVRRQLVVVPFLIKSQSRAACQHHEQEEQHDCGGVVRYEVGHSLLSKATDRNVGGQPHETYDREYRPTDESCQATIEAEVGDDYCLGSKAIHHHIVLGAEVLVI